MHMAKKEIERKRESMWEKKDRNKTALTNLEYL